jgi:hypothetical protein
MAVDAIAVMEAEILFFDPDLDFEPAIAALVELGFEVEVLDHADARIMIRILTPLSEDEFHVWVESLATLIEHDGNILSWGRANRVN